MKEYTQQEQVDIVKSAMILTEALELTQSELARQSSTTFKECPDRPERRVVHYNEVQPPVVIRPQPDFAKYWQTHGGMKVLWILVGMMMFPFGILFFFLWRGELAKKLQAECDAEYNRYLESPEYRERVRQYETEVANSKIAASKLQAQADEEYAQALNHYNSIILPEYELQKSDWTARKEATLQFLRDEMNKTTQELNTIYDESKLISAHYRDIDILKWLYLDMSTSDHDIRYATELLDRDRQRAQTASTNEIIQSEVSELKSALSSDLQSVKSAIMCGNELLLDVDSELGRIRKRTTVAAIGAGVAGYKALKS